MFVGRVDGDRSTLFVNTACVDEHPWTRAVLAKSVAREWFFAWDGPWTQRLRGTHYLSAQAVNTGLGYSTFYSRVVCMTGACRHHENAGVENDTRVDGPLLIVAS